MDEGLSLRAVAARFEDSERLLTSARERLDELSAAGERQLASSQSLDESATAVKDFVLTARELIAELVTSQEHARQILESGARVLDGSALAEIRAAVDGLRSELPARVDDLAERFADRREVERHLEARDQRIGELESEIASVIGARDAAARDASAAKEALSEAEAKLQIIRDKQNKAYRRALGE